jgi:choline dehydrogenase-like flavoprotein
MLYVRCLESDILRWNLTQEGWTWNDVLKTYKSLENFIPDTNEGIPAYHGTGSGHALTTSRFLDRNLDPIGAEFVSSSIQSGYQYVNDFNNPEKKSRVGVGYYHFNIDAGKRDSVANRMLASAFLSSSSSSSSSSTSSSNEKSHQPSAFPILSSSKHLTISTYSKVEKVLLHSIGSGTSVRAIGVEYTQDGIKRRAFLQSKTHRLSPSSSSQGLESLPNSLSVILTAGALLTPQLLMNSGIGPEEELTKANIPVRVLSPLVGSNLQDHPAIGMTFHAHPSLAASLSTPHFSFPLSPPFPSPPEYPSAYSLLSHWSKYVKAVQVQADRSGDDLRPPPKVPASEYGVLGTAGFSAGGFLISPYAKSKHDPDVQLTVFPVVSPFS